MYNTNYEMFKGMIMGKKVAVLGLGVSNLPAIKFLHNHGAKVTGCDKSSREAFDDKTYEYLMKYCETLHFGDSYLDDLCGFDILLKSPGINPSLPQIQKAKDAGAKNTLALVGLILGIVTLVALVAGSIINAVIGMATMLPGLMESL